MSDFEVCLSQLVLYASYLVEILVSVCPICSICFGTISEQIFYYQKDGIIVGDNILVLLANIAVHCVMCQVSTKTKHAEIFKEFIDDNTLLNFGNQDFRGIFKYNLSPKNKEINTTEKDGEVKFLIFFPKFLPIFNIDLSLQTTLNLQHLIFSLVKLYVGVVVAYQTPSEGWGHGGRPWSHRSRATPQGLDQRS